MQDINNAAFLMISIFVLIPFFISYSQKLGMEKAIIFSSIKGLIQLLLLGVFVTYLFSMEHLFLVSLYILFMIIIASLNASKRGGKRSSSFFIVFVAILTTVAISLLLWVSFSVVPPEARYLIPVSGMFIGSGMIACAVILETMKGHKEKICEMALKREALKIAMIPTIDGLKTVGLVQIPGTMTGMILAGGDPFESVKYQIFIIFTLMGVTALASIMTTLMYYKFLLKSKISE